MALEGSNKLTNDAETKSNSFRERVFLREGGEKLVSKEVWRNTAASVCD
jgi:hypothetical protein